MKTAKNIISVFKAVALTAAKAVVACIVWAVCFILSFMANMAGGIIQLAVGCITVLVSVAAFFGFILWLLTL